MDRRKFLGTALTVAVVVGLPMTALGSLQKHYFVDRYRGIRIYFSGTYQATKAQIFTPDGKEYALGFTADNHGEYTRRLNTLRFVTRHTIDNLLGPELWHEAFPDEIYRAI